MRLREKTKHRKHTRARFRRAHLDTNAPPRGVVSRQRRAVQIHTHTLPVLVRLNFSGQREISPNRANAFLHQLPQQIVEGAGFVSAYLVGEGWTFAPPSFED